jgi:hypothetical protein
MDAAMLRMFCLAESCVEVLILKVIALGVQDFVK